MYPSDPAKAPFKELRQVIPIRLTSHPWLPDGNGLRHSTFGGSETSLTLPIGDEEDSSVELGHAQ